MFGTYWNLSVRWLTPKLAWSQFCQRRRRKRRSRRYLSYIISYMRLTGKEIMIVYFSLAVKGIIWFYAFRCLRRRWYQRWWLLRERTVNPGGGARFVYFPLLMGDLFVIFFYLLIICLFSICFLVCLSGDQLYSLLVSLFLFFDCVKVNCLKEEQRVSNVSMWFNLQQTIGIVNNSGRRAAAALGIWRFEKSCTDRWQLLHTVTNLHITDTLIQDASKNSTDIALLF